MDPVLTTYQNREKIQFASNNTKLFISMAADLSLNHTYEYIFRDSFKIIDRNRMQ